MLARSRLLLPLSFSLIGLACSSTTGTVFEPQSYPRQALRAQLREITVVDGRGPTRAGNFDTPIVSLPGSE